jgi:hypothetical protein
VSREYVNLRGNLRAPAGPLYFSVGTMSGGLAVLVFSWSAAGSAVRFIVGGVLIAIGAIVGAIIIRRRPESTDNRRS